MKIEVDVGDGILNKDICRELFEREYDRVVEERRSYFNFS